jgi:hypothetical protein
VVVVALLVLLVLLVVVVMLLVMLVTTVAAVAILAAGTSRRCITRRLRPRAGSELIFQCCACLPSTRMKGQIRSSKRGIIALRILILCHAAAASSSGRSHEAALG